MYHEVFINEFVGYILVDIAKESDGFRVTSDEFALIDGFADTVHDAIVNFRNALLKDYMPHAFDALQEPEESDKEDAPLKDKYLKYFFSEKEPE